MQTDNYFPLFQPAVKQEAVSSIAPESKPKVTTYATNTPFLPVSKSPTVPPSSGNQSFEKHSKLNRILVASNTPLINLPSHPEKTLIPPQPGETITYAGSSPRQPAAPRPMYYIHLNYLFNFFSSTSQKQETVPKPVSIPVPQNSTPIVIPSDPVTPTPTKPVLGQPRAGVEQGPRPDPDEDHPCGPFSAQEDNARTYRTIEKIQFKKAFFGKSFYLDPFLYFLVRNWEYSDGNSCARTDLFYCDEPESSGTTISRRNPTAATHSPARPATGR